MKKIFVAIALIAGLGTSSVAFANAKTTNEISIQLNVADYTPIEVKDLPQAIQDALTKNFSEYTVKSAAYQEDEDGVKIYQVTVVDEEGTEANIFFTEKGTLSKILCKWKQDSVVSLFLYLNSVFKHKHKLIHNQAPV